MIVGNDVSEWQGQIDWPKYVNNSNFALLRTSYGLNYIDKWFAYNREQARKLNFPIGYYHYCKPDLGNSPEDEAKFMCSLIDGVGIKPGEVIALDFEVNYADGVNWCKRFMDYVSNHYGGIKVFIYLDQAHVKNYNWSPIINAGYPLWLASYNPDGVGDKGSWPKITMQQWTSSQGVPGIPVQNVDGDHFFGTLEEFKALGYKIKVSPSASSSSSVSPSISPSASRSSSLSPSSSTSKSISPSPSVSPSDAPVDDLEKVRLIVKSKWSGWPFYSNYWKNKQKELDTLLNG